MDGLVQIAPECPVCRAHHTQSFTRDELRERLRQQPLELYCPRFDKRWPAEAMHLEALMRAIGGSARRSDETATAR
jgi:hypothetical protein